MFFSEKNQAGLTHICKVGFAFVTDAQSRWSIWELSQHRASAGYSHCLFDICRVRCLGTQEFLNFQQPRAFDVAAEFTPQILRLGQSPLLFVSFGFDDSEKQRLDFAQVAVANGEVNAKAIPRLAVPVFQVVAEPGTKI